MTPIRVKEIRRYLEIQEALRKSATIRKEYQSSQERMQELYRAHGTAGPTTERHICPNAVR